MSDCGFISLENNLAKCRLALFGADLLSYLPKGETHDVFWLGDLNKFDRAQAIRGGVPVCWLRFAAEKLNDVPDVPDINYMDPKELTSNCLCSQMKNIACRSAPSCL